MTTCADVSGLAGRVLLAAMCAILAVGCAAPRPGGHVYPDYSTAYLGPDGQIVFGAKPPQGPGNQPPPRPAPDRSWTWDGDGVSGKPSITIDLSEQVATFYKGNTPVGRSPVSTGREGHNTPTGTFNIIEKNADHASNLYGDFVNGSGEVVRSNVENGRDRCPPGAHFRGAPMPYFMRVNDAVGMHAGYLPGYPASHGCIRMPRGAAEVFFQNAPVGTPVTIVH